LSYVYPCDEAPRIIDLGEVSMEVFYCLGVELAGYFCVDRSLIVDFSLGGAVIML
jgi:hypothetical protein